MNNEAPLLVHVSFSWDRLMHNALFVNFFFFLILACMPIYSEPLLFSSSLKTFANRRGHRKTNREIKLFYFDTNIFVTILFICKQHPCLGRSFNCFA